MKVIIIGPYLTSTGGAGRFTYEFSNHLVKQGDSVILATLFTDKNLFPEKTNLKIVDIGNKNSLTQTMKFWLNLEKIRKNLKRIIENENPEVILFMNFPATLWAQKFANIPILCYPQDINLLYTDTYIKNLSIKKFLMWKILRIFIRIIDKKRWRYFDEVICNSKYSSSFIKEKYKINTSVIYPGTDTHLYTISEKEIEEKPILLMANGKTTRAEFFLENVQELVKKRNDFKIWIVGNNEEYGIELKKLVKKLEIEHMIEFFGRVTDEKLRELYSKSLVSINLQKSHPFGLVFIESMSCGTPVIGCKPGATEEIIIEGKTGFLVDENDSKNLINCVQKILNNPKISISLGNSARERVEKKFEMSNQFEKIREIMLEHIKIKK